MVVSEIKLYEMLKAKIGSQEAEAFVRILETKVDTKFEDAKATLATKEDLANQISSLRSDMLKAIFYGNLATFLAIVAGVSGIMFAILKAAGVLH